VPLLKKLQQYEQNRGSQYCKLCNRAIFPDKEKGLFGTGAALYLRLDQPHYPEKRCRLLSAKYPAQLLVKDQQVSFVSSDIRFRVWSPKV
jgi:hypothetical protein